MKSRVVLCLVAAGFGWALGLMNPGAKRLAEPATPKPANERPARPRAISGLNRNIEPVAGAMNAEAADKKHLAHEWAGKDADQFLSWLLRTKPVPGEEVVIAFFSEWVRTNPDAAFEAALSLPDQFSEGLQARLLTRMLSAALNSDWRTGLAWVERAQDAGAGALRLAADLDWLKEPTLEMGQALAKLAPGGASQSLLSHFATSFVKLDFEVAREWALSLPPEHAYWTMGPILHQWAAKDLPGALAYLETTASSSVRQTLGEVVLTAYARQNPRAALEWAETHMGVPGSSRHVLTTWVRANTQGATDFVVALEDPQQRETYLRFLADAARRRNVPTVLDWVKPLSPENRAPALQAVTSEILTWSKNEPRQQFLDYLASLPEAELTNELIGKMARGLSHRNQIDSLRWAAALPGDRADRAVGVMVKAWVKMNREHAVRHIEALEPGPVREAAMGVLGTIKEE